MNYFRRNWRTFGFLFTGRQNFKQVLNTPSGNVNDDAEEMTATMYVNNTSLDVEIFLFQNLCTEIYLEIFQYLRPADILYSFVNLSPRLNARIEPYTHTFDCRLISKSQSQQLIERLFPCLTNNLRVLSLSNAHTFNLITDILYKLDWSSINQLESLTFDSIKPDELSRYFLNIHPLLKHLWRLALTIDEENKLAEKLLIEHVLLPSNRPQSLTCCFIDGIIFTLNRSVPQKCNDCLRELTLTLATLTDLLVLFQIIPHLEILTCTIRSGECSESVNKVQSFDRLVTLTLTIKSPMTFNTLQKILIPHKELQCLSLIATLSSEMTPAQNSNQEISGLSLEKLFRTFPKLKKLRFYFGQLNSTMDSASDSLHLFPFTSHFWLDRSIAVGTHFVLNRKQRYTYTLPFAFDTLVATDLLSLVLPVHYSSQYGNVRHLLLSSMVVLNEYTYSHTILKFFPKIQTLTFSQKPSSCNTINLLNKFQWVLTRSQTDASVNETQPYVYILNDKKSRQLHFRTLPKANEVHPSFFNHTGRIRQLTIYEMSEEQAVNVISYFPRLYVLTLHVHSLEWLFPPKSDWFFRLLTNIISLFSLTIHYPRNVDEQKLRDFLANTLVTVKKHFYIKCNDGLLIVWF